MKWMPVRWGIFLCLLWLSGPVQAALVKGIYITQSTLENTQLINYLIERSQKAGISTFVVDLELPSKRYQTNIELLKKHHIHYVARIVMYPGGATAAQVSSNAYLEKKYRLIEQAVAYGAGEIQLDYIRYNTKQPPSPQNAQNILKIIQWIKTRLDAQNIPLQIDVFGIASFGESKYIGQNIKLFASSVDAICPMVYPSHYEPFREHAVKPYQTVYSSLRSIQKQFDYKMPVKLIPYIELSNYRYPLSHSKKMDYILSQIKAAEDAGADGWYVWSPHNKYDNLFAVLASYPAK